MISPSTPRIHAFDFQRHTETEQPASDVLAFQDADDGAAAWTVVVAVGRVFSDRGEHHLAVRQGGGIGEGEWNSVDSSEIDGLDGERLDREFRFAVSTPPGTPEAKNE